MVDVVFITFMGIDARKIDINVGEITVVRDLGCTQPSGTPIVGVTMRGGAEYEVVSTMESFRSKMVEAVQ